MKCSICNEEINATTDTWDASHSASPVNDGRCCELCNWQTVIPARMAELFSVVRGKERRKKEEEDE